MNRRSTMSRAVLLLGAMLIVCGCASVRDRRPVPEPLVDLAEIPGIPQARHWADGPMSNETEDWFELPDEVIQRRHSGVYARDHHYLAISGGGPNGAYGAGLLNGWTRSGTRPEFVWVTGISTGALIAPFAFLGSDYDWILEEVYTTLSTKDIITERSTLKAITGDAFTSTRPLAKLIARYVDDEIVEAIAAEHRRGRRLVIGTTNIDAARPVMWSIGAIADSDSPDKKKIIQDVMLASASIPVAMPPVFFEVEADGQKYDEMHVDGGATTQVFLYPAGFEWDRVLERLKVTGTPKVWVIRNAKLKPDWAAVRPKVGAIASRTVKSLLRTQGAGDLVRIYMLAVRDGLTFSYTSISEEFDEQAEEAFDPVYMKRLFDYGAGLGESGRAWIEYDREDLLGDSQKGKP